MLRSPDVDRMLGHGRELRLHRVLDDADATAAHDRGHAGCPIAHQPAEDHADHPGAVVPGGAPEEHVRGRAVAELRRAVVEMGVPATDDHVIVGRSNDDPARDDWILVAGVNRRQWAGAAQDVRQRALHPRREVDHHDHRRGEARRQCRDQAADSRDGARRSRDDDDIAARWWGSERGLPCGARTHCLVPAAVPRAEGGGGHRLNLKNADGSADENMIASLCR